MEEDREGRQAGRQLATVEASCANEAGRESERTSGLESFSTAPVSYSCMAWMRTRKLDERRGNETAATAARSLAA